MDRVGITDACIILLYFPKVIFFFPRTFHIYKDTIIVLRDPTTLQLPIILSFCCVFFGFALNVQLTLTMYHTVHQKPLPQHIHSSLPWEKVMTNDGKKKSKQNAGIKLGGGGGTDAIHKEET